MIYLLKKSSIKLFCCITGLLTLHCAAAHGRNVNSIPLKVKAVQQSAALLFTENRGQVADDAGKPRPDILFTAQGAATRVFLTATGIHYQFTKVTYPEGYDRNGQDMQDLQLQAALEKKTETQTYRFSLTLAGANPHPHVRKEGKNTFTENFYLPQCPGGITGVSTYERLVYEEVYPGIDWVVYSNGSHLKYDFIVRPGGDAAQIKLDIKDAQSVTITKSGELLMKTTLGEVREQAPISYAGGEKVRTRFIKNNDGSIGFGVTQQPDQELRIDPSVTWSTYYGGSGTEFGYGCSVDPWGYVYLSGYTLSASGIATSGGFQTTLGGGSDCMLVKFDASGARIWATYYGGPGSESAPNCCVDNSGNVFLSGYTSSTTAIATSGAHQTVSAGGTGDCFLAKFDSSGARQWATYFGGPGDELNTNCATDAAGNVYIASISTSATGISTTGVYQPALAGGNDAILAKFSTSGSLLWATYYGGTASEYTQNNSVATDNTGNVYMAGYTSSSAGIATVGAHQTSFAGGSNDCYLVKFDGSGARLWGTYYGGPGNEQASASCATDAFGNVFLTFETNSTTGISSAGAHQAASGGGFDAGLVKFNSTGVRRWATYYGGTATEIGQEVTADAMGNVYIVGVTGSATGISTGSAFQLANGGGNDAYIAAFDSTGVRQWGSYLGGTASDNSFSCASDGNGSIYMAGIASSTAAISTPGAYQPANGGGQDAFLTKIGYISITTGTITGSPFCAGASVSVPFTINGTFIAGNVFTAQLSDSSGSFAIPVNIGTLTGTTAGTISATLPVVTTGGTHFRIRVVGSLPPIIGSVNVSDIIISLPPAAGTITGTPTVCVGATTTLADATPGGTWSSTAPGIATVGTSGVVTGVTAGTATISYTVTNACGIAAATVVVTVNPLPAAGMITGTPFVCVGATTTLANATTGGTWSSAATGVATVGTSGVVAGVTADTVTIFYAVTNSCGTAAATIVVTVSPLPLAGTITGTPFVCVGSTTLLSDATPGGVWSSTAPGTASVGTSGLVTGITAGTATISYTATNSCGSVAATIVVTVDLLPAAGTITGTPLVCMGATTLLSDATPGGTWSSTAPGIASVGTSGLVAGITAGTATISYTVANSCGTVAATTVVTVDPLPAAGTITGTPLACIGSTTALADATPGGVWSSTAPGIASVGTSGLVTGVTAGTATISYTATNSCGTVAATVVVTVDPVPAAGTITGIPVVCIGATTALADATPGGTWSSTAPGIASVDIMGVVTGAALGTATISYTVTNSCGTAAATVVVTVSATPSAGPITGPSSVCIGATIILADATPGGVWSSTVPGVASISTSGAATGLATGTTTISYTVSYSCGTAAATRVITVSPAPAAGTITGTPSVCIGFTTTLADATPGGTWSSTAPGIAPVSTSGVVTGLAAGTATISYTVTNSCGSAAATVIVTVNVAPVAGTITGTPVVCEAATTHLFIGSTGGVWSSFPTSIAAVDTNGIVIGVLAGTALISYTITTSCGFSVATRMVTVYPLPVVGTISGTSVICAGAATTLTASAPGGVWSSAATGIATVGTSGVVTGVSGGTAIISYTVTNGCGPLAATRMVTVIPVPAAGPISGSSVICVGDTTSLTATPPGGTWISTIIGVATINTSGRVTGVSGGTTTISYMVFNSCGIASSTKTVTVNSLPAAGIITGSSVICLGATKLMTNAATGGKWSSNDTGKVKIDSTGTALGIATGTTLISYTVTNSCGTAGTTKSVTVNPLPTPVIVRTGNILSTSIPFTTYQWLLGGIAIPGATSATLVAATTGTYSVIINNNYGCAATAAGQLVPGLGVNNRMTNGDDISIYPNPASTILTVSAPRKVSISILSMAGSELIEKEEATNIDVSSLAPGVYMVRIFNDEHALIRTLRFTKN